MAQTKPNECLVGLELSGTQIRIATMLESKPGTGQLAQLRCDEMEIPDAEVCAPGELPAASVLAAALKASLSRLGAGSGRAAVAIAQPYMVLRYSVGTNDEVRAELGHAAERSLGYIRFGLGDRAIADVYQQIAENQVCGLLAVTAAATIASLTEGLESVGFRVCTIEPALVALIRMALLTRQLGAQPSFVVCAASPAIEVGLVTGGRLLLSHCPSLTKLRGDSQTENSGASGVSYDLHRELERVSRRYVRAFGEPQEVHRVLIGGREDLARAYASTLAGSAGIDVEIVNPGNVVGEVMSASPEELQGAVSHGIALGAAASLVPQTSLIAGPNLASAPEERTRPPLDLLLRVLLVPSLVAVGVWGALHLVQERVDAKVAELRIEAERPSPAEGKHNELQLELTRLEQRAMRLSQLSERFGDRQWKELIETVRVCVPDQLWLTRVRLTDQGGIVVEGAAGEESFIYDLAKNLEGAPLFASATVVTLTGSRHENVVVTEFVIECELRSDFPEPDSIRP